ncbi:MAG TPA: hypothetical protein VII66_10195 [Gemmatimonadaceae bacterium]
MDNSTLMHGTARIEQALQALGEILSARQQEIAIVLIGGAALNLLGFVQRPTRDVDILAFGAAPGAFPPLPIIEPPTPMPASLIDGIRLVAGELRLTADWLNTGPALQWKQGLPPGLEARVHWRRYGALTVGLVDRYDLIFFKLYAAADATGPQSRHYQDLFRLNPNRTEIEAAVRWVTEQDPTPSFAEVVDRVVNYLASDLAAYE